MTRPFAPLPCALALLLGLSTASLADDPAFPGRDLRPPTAAFPGPAVVAPPIVPMPTGAALPLVPTAIPVRRPLGTFRQDPALVSYTGPGITGAYTPGGLPRSYGTMSFYGPFSRLRALPEEVVVYSRGYDGVLRPTSSGVAYEYTDPRQYRDTTLVPTGFQYDPLRGTRTRPGFGRYVLGQE